MYANKIENIGHLKKKRLGPFILGLEGVEFYGES